VTPTEKENASSAKNPLLKYFEYQWRAVLLLSMGTAYVCLKIPKGFASVLHGCELRSFVYLTHEYFFF
jgi:hypothetical protein